MQVGLIAGTGDLPSIIAQDARQRGYRVVTIAIEHFTSPDLSAVSDDIVWINLGKISLIISTLRERGVTEVIMAGKIPKSLLYKSKIDLDLKAVKILLSLKNRSDDSILTAIEQELRKEGLHLIDTATFSPHLLTPEMLLTKCHPSRDEWKDIEFGWKIAREIGRLDIGQTVVVKDKAVMAVEAIEGTDEAIMRGGHWAGEGAVVVKASKPHQSMRLDVPVVGTDTLDSMIKVKARVLAIEAQRSMIVNREVFIMEADNAGIAVVGYKGSE
jgi:DUF1009 family protein